MKRRRDGSSRNSTAKLSKNNSKRIGPNLFFRRSGEDGAREYLWQIGRRIAGGGIDIVQFMKSEAEDSWRRKRIAGVACLDHEPLASVIETRQADCDAGCWPLLNPRLCTTQSSCRLTICFY